MNNLERDEKVFQLREKGEKLTAIGKMFGISKERV